MLTFKVETAENGAQKIRRAWLEGKGATCLNSETVAAFKCRGDAYKFASALHESAKIDVAIIERGKMCNFFATDNRGNSDIVGENATYIPASV